MKGGCHPSFIGPKICLDKVGHLIGNVINGTYTLTVTKTSHVSYTIRGITITGNSLDLGMIELPFGDVDGNGIINQADADEITTDSYYLRGHGGILTFDLDGDGAVTQSDLSIILRQGNFCREAIQVYHQ